MSRPENPSRVNRVEKIAFFYFGGTGSPVWFRGGSGGPACLRRFKYEHKFKMSPNCLRVYFEGCHDHRIGGRRFGGDIDPNLDVISEKLRRCFTPGSDKKATLSIGELKRLFGNSIRIEPEELAGDDVVVDVTKIVMSGYSRGAVTCSAAVRWLDELAVPMHAFAQDPVPGNTLRQAATDGSEYKKNADLIKYAHLMELIVSVGTYRSDLFFAQNIFFRQMLSKAKNHSYFKTYRPHHLAMTNDIVIAELEKFLFKCGVVTELVNNTPNVAKTRTVPIPEVLTHELHGDLSFKDVLPPETQKEILADRIGSFFSEKRSEMVTDYVHQMALYALSRRYEKERNIPPQLLNAIFKKPNVASFIVEIDAIVRLNIEGSDPSQKTKNTIHDCLKKIDRLVLDSQCKELKLTNIALYHKIIGLVQYMLRTLPLPHKGRMLQNIRKELTENRLKLNPPSVADKLCIKRKKPAFSALVSASTITAIGGSSAAFYAGFLLNTCAQSAQLTYGLLLSLIALATIAGVVVLSLKAEENHSRYWTLLKPGPSPDKQSEASTLTKE